MSIYYVLLYVYIYIYIYIYTHTHTYTYTHIFAGRSVVARARRFFQISKHTKLKSVEHVLARAARLSASARVEVVGTSEVRAIYFTNYYYYYY